MFSPYLGFQERDILGVFKVSVATSSGTAMQRDTTDTSPRVPSTYANSLGSVTAASILSSNGNKEIGWLLQPVSTAGPSLLSILSSVYDESVPALSTAAVVASKPGCHIATDQYVASSTGSITTSTALDTTLGIASGMLRTVQGGDATRATFQGFVVQRRITCVLAMIL